MTPFVLIAVAMVAIALAVVLVPLLRRGTPGVSREVSNVAILRDQLRELDSDLATGTMPRDRYEQSKRELEDRALEESREIRGTPAPPSQSTACQSVSGRARAAGVSRVAIASGTKVPA